MTAEWSLVDEIGRFLPLDGDPEAACVRADRLIAAAVTAGKAGLVVGVVLLGTIGVLDPLSPDNVDFEILAPRWLAVTLVVVTALLLGVTFTATAARLDEVSVVRGRRRYVVYVGLVVMWLFLPLAGLYIGNRALSHGRVSAWLSRPRTQHIGTALTRLIVIATLIITLVASGAILAG